MNIGIPIDSLSYCQRNKGLAIVALCIMVDYAGEQGLLSIILIE
jgi:hypothetical protein